MSFRHLLASTRLPLSSGLMGTCSTSSFIHGDPNTGLTLARQGLYQWSLFLSPRDFFPAERKKNEFILFGPMYTSEQNWYQQSNCRDGGANSFTSIHHITPSVIVANNSNWESSPQKLSLHRTSTPSSASNLQEHPRTHT